MILKIFFNIFMICLILFMICTILYLVLVAYQAITGNKEEGESLKTIFNPQRPKTMVENKLGDEDFDFTISGNDPDFFCSIAGVQYRNDEQDIGGFLGYVRPEPTNPHDRNAIAIYRNDNKKLGYIPMTETSEFRKWSKKEYLPCVGYIQIGDYVPLYGKVKIIDADTETTNLEIAKFIRWLIANFGATFLPVGTEFTDGQKPRSKDSLLEYFDEYIDEKEDEIY